MAEGELARKTVEVLSHYLTRKAADGHAAFNGQLESVLGIVEGEFADAFRAEVFGRFVNKPRDPVELETMRLHLDRAVSLNQEFARELASALAGRELSRIRDPRRSRRWKLLFCALAGILALSVTAFFIGRGTRSDSVSGVPPVAPATVERTSANPPPDTNAPSSTLPPESSTQLPVSAVPGDGGSMARGAAVLLVNLPRPNDDWDFSHGDHDVQLTQYTDSVWNMLSTCNSSAYRGEQQFRLRNFTRLEVKAVGTDSTASPELAVKFEVFANDDAVNAIKSVVVAPGKVEKISVDLPSDVFALTFRTSLTTAPGKPCLSGNAVWGSPYVVAAGRQ